MARPLRLEFAGALYHVTSRGNRRSAIYLDHSDRRAWLEVLADTCSRYNFIVHAYCQMTDHYHLLIETVDGKLGRGIRHLNAVYSQQFNRRHALVGHVFQGRYKGILVQKESYLLELTRYVVLNPVRAGMVASHEDWPWSSHRQFMHPDRKPEWLNSEWLLSQFSSDPVRARNAYNQFVLRGRGLLNPLRDVKHQTLLGDKEFVNTRIEGGKPNTLCDINRMQRCVIAIPLDEYAAKYGDRNEAMARAYFSTAYTMPTIAKFFSVSTKTVGRAVKKFKV